MATKKTAKQPAKKKATKKPASAKTKTTKKTNPAKKPAKKPTQKKPATELASLEELLSFIDTRVDDDRFRLFAARTGLKKVKLYDTPAYQEYKDKKNGIVVSYSQGWIYTVSIGPQYTGSLAHGLVMGAAREAVHRALGRPVFSRDNVEKIDRDLWRWHVSYDDNGLEELCVCPIDIETDQRKSGEPPRR